MKIFQHSRFAATILIVLFAISLSNCSVHTKTGSTSWNSSRTIIKSKPLPPGQAKKIHGEKSARRFAPGHNK